jgi:molecular chaperone Hsp33
MSDQPQNRLPQQALPDAVMPFQLENGLLRGRLVRMSSVLDEMLAKHGYPEPVAKLLAETAVTGTALATLLKYAGRFTLQMRGDGPVALLVADTTDQGGVRAYAKYDAAGVTHMGDEGIGLLGQGHLAFTVEPEDAAQERYQGIVALRGKDVAAAAENYFRQSEQIPTALFTAVARDAASGHWQGGCLILQLLPAHGGTAQDLPHGMSAAEFWQHVLVLLRSCTQAELLDPALPAATLLYRLFHGEGVVSQPAQALRHACGCAERIETAVRLFSRAEVVEMAEADGLVKMSCQFCNSHYAYDAAAIARIFTDNA